MGRDMSSIIIVDNSPVSYCLQPENGIPIRSWFDDVRDRELPALATFLIELNKFKDIRTVLSRVALDEIASKPATSSIALLDSIMERTKQNILKEMRKNQLTNSSNASNTTVTTANTSNMDSFKKEGLNKHNNNHSHSTSHLNNNKLEHSKDPINVNIKGSLKHANVKMNLSRDTDEKVIVKNVRCSHSPVRKEYFTPNQRTNNNDSEREKEREKDLRDLKEKELERELLYQQSKMDS